MTSTFDRRIAFVAFAAAFMASAALAQNNNPPPPHQPAATDAQAPAPAPTVADAPAPTPDKPKPKPKKKVPPSVVVVVTNSRAVVLTKLEATADGGSTKTIVSDLPPGKKKSVKVEHGKSCVFDLHGDYADGSTSDSASVDLCKDKTVNLVD
jgi:glucose/arabinose dehydrogenase